MDFIHAWHVSPAGSEWYQQNVQKIRNHWKLSSPRSSRVLELQDSEGEIIPKLTSILQSLQDYFTFSCLGLITLIIKLYEVMLLLLLPLSATDNVLLKYCSSRTHEASFNLVEIPQEPWQFTLMATEREKKIRKHDSLRNTFHSGMTKTYTWSFLIICRLVSWLKSSICIWYYVTKRVSLSANIQIFKFKLVHNPTLGK